MFLWHFGQISDYIYLTHIDTNFNILIDGFILYGDTILTVLM